VSFDTANLKIYYHTDDDRTLRVVDFASVDWDELDGVSSFPMRLEGPRTLVDVTP
jgi:hypothetical protein